MEEKSDKFYKKGIIAGSALTTTGGLVYLVNRHLDNSIDQNKLKKVIKSKRTRELLGKKSLERGKKVGLSMLPLGIATTAISGYKHYKNKKKREYDNL